MATVAADDPEIAAKMAQPNIFICIKPPGNFDSQGDKPLNKFSDNFVRNKISPIQTKSGRAVSDQDDPMLHMVVAIASPTGLEVNIIIPIVETPIMLIPTQTPDPRNINKTLIKNIVR